jgi:hypothetical protein
MEKKSQSRKRARLFMRFYEGVRFGGAFYLVELLWVAILPVDSLCERVS